MSFKSLFSTLVAMTATLGMVAEAPSVKWETLGNRSDGKRGSYTQRFTISNHDDLKRLCFNQFKRPMQAVNPADTVAEIIPGYFYIASSRFGQSKEPVVIDVVTGGSLVSQNWIPEGYHAVMANGDVIPVKSARSTLLQTPEMWSMPGKDKLLYGDTIYRLNERLAKSEPIGPYDIIPSFKKVTMSGKGTFTAQKPIVYRKINNPNKEFYRIIITPDSAVIEAPNDRTAAVARRVLVDRLLASNNGVLPCAVIEDYPDFPYRGVMIDISRNYQNYDNMKHVAELLARYRFNYLHFHPIDDEAWRLEIPGLPELTEYGSRRGYTTDENDFLAQTYSGKGDPNSVEGTANGYFTRDQFISFIKYCDGLGIKVIPEIESPGHARAAVKAMEKRYRTTGDDTYRMIEDNDTSRYTTAQDYHDNLMNPALTGTYRFMEKVIDEIAAMYRDANVELPGIHIGGDEVPAGAWDGSPSAIKMSKELGVSGRHGLQGEFVKKVTAMMKSKGIPVYGWQEIGTGYDEAFNAEVAPAVGGVNCWHDTKPGNDNYALKARRAGYPVILSNVDYNYLDLQYSNHPEERGLMWGGYVDEFRTLSGYPEILCPEGEGVKAPVIGVQGQLFSETMRSFPMLQRFLLPKMFGLAERGWNSKPTYTDAKFNRVIGERELPQLSADGIAFHMRQPGIIVKNGKALMNSPYEGATIRYTLDGSEPTIDSPVYTVPVPVGKAKEIRAKLFYLGEPSVTTLLYVK